MTDILDKLKTIVGKEKRPECALDDLEIQYDTIEDIDWEDDGKYQYGFLVIEVKERYFGIGVTRSGSYFSDYYYHIDDITELKKHKVYKVEAKESYVSLDYTQDTSELLETLKEITQELTNE